MNEFLILRRGEPFLFGLELGGVTWVDPLLFERPIEKLGSDLELFWDGELFDWDKVHITRLLAHWKKMLNRRAKKAEKPLNSIVDMEPLTKQEREEFLFSVNRGEKTSETVLLRTEEGYALKFLVRIFGKPKSLTLNSFHTRAEAVAWRNRELVRERMDPAKEGIYEYLSRLAWRLHGRTDEEAQQLLAEAHREFQKVNSHGNRPN